MTEDPSTNTDDALRYHAARVRAKTQARDDLGRFLADAEALVTDEPAETEESKAAKEFDQALREAASKPSRVSGRRPASDLHL
jgi:hypothetical protein